MLKTSMQDYEKIGGWLIVVAIGLFMTAIKMLVSLVADYAPLFSNGTWIMLLTSPGVANGVAIAVFLLLEVLINLSFIAFSVFLLFQMRDKKPTFPKSAQIFYVSNFVFVFLDLVVYFQLFPNPTESPVLLYSEFVRATISTAIWVPYFLRSKRVKETFRARQSSPSGEGHNEQEHTVQP